MTRGWLITSNQLKQITVVNGENTETCTNNEVALFDTEPPKRQLYTNSNQTIIQIASIFRGFQNILESAKAANIFYSDPYARLDAQ